MANIAVIGTGYVGLTTGAYLAHLGHHVVCADVVVEKVENLNKGIMPILEDGLEELVRAGVDGGRLRFVVGEATAVRDADAEFIFLCVPTPQSDDGSADLSYIEEAARNIGPVLSSESVVINKSTVPVGSTLVVERALGRGDVAVVSNPEFLREGSAVHDCLHPDRIVIGSEDQAAAIRVASLFSDIKAPVILTDPASAETIKYVSNAFLATKISFVNAVANLCEAVGADVRDVVVGMGYDRRIGFEYLNPGPGWGGSCFPSGARALLKVSKDSGYDFSLLENVIEVNHAQFDLMVTKITAIAGGSLSGKTIAVWGLAFKAGTDDSRCSPAIEIIRRLQGLGASVRAYDPAVVDTPTAVERSADPYTVCENADVLALLTDWNEFSQVDLEKVAALMNEARLVDCRNALDPVLARRAGFVYEGIGQPSTVL